VNADCTQLELVHKTPMDEVPFAVAPFQGRILVGVGRMLRLYDMGRKKLLRKCENKVEGYRLYVV
jgi:splicing factor 3B subunit 3